MEVIERMTIAGRRIRGLLHVGANHGQERLEYHAAGIAQIIHVEPIDAAFAQLSRNIAGLAGQVAVQALCSSEEDERLSINIASNGEQSSSIFELGAHAKFFPDIKYVGKQDVVSTTVDRLLDGFVAKPNVVVIDTQGADLKVLQGAVRSLNGPLEAVYVEVSEDPLYEGGCTFDQLTAFLLAFGFRLRWLDINGWGIGDAFYLRLRPLTP